MYVIGYDVQKQVLAVLSFGYGILQDGMTLGPAEERSYFFALVLLAVALGKIVTTGLTTFANGIS